MPDALIHFIHFGPPFGIIGDVLGEISGRARRHRHGAQLGETFSSCGVVGATASWRTPIVRLPTA
jgi:hypothetical protein